MSQHALQHNTSRPVRLRHHPAPKCGEGAAVLGVSVRTLEVRHAGPDAALEEAEDLPLVHSVQVEEGPEHLEGDLEDEIDDESEIHDDDEDGEGLLAVDVDCRERRGRRGVAGASQ